MLAELSRAAPSLPPWAQAGITDVVAARAFLAVLSGRDTLVIASGDGDRGFRRRRATLRFRGQAAHPGPSCIAATPPPEDLAEYHRSLGLGPERVFCPAPSSRPATLAELTLRDATLCERLRADRELARILVSFKDESAARLIEHLGLEAACCAPPPSAYEAANDKLVFALAGARHGFETIPAAAVDDPADLPDAFDRLARRWGAGCIVRLRRGAGGHHIHRARTLREARRAWRRLRPRGEVMLTSYVPAEIVIRNVAVSGIATESGFAPLVFSDQLVRKNRFRGGRVTSAWDDQEIAVVCAGLAGAGRWLRELGYTGAPAGIDGFLVRERGELHFLALDPNARMTGTMLPWAVMATVSERAGRSFDWQFEWFPLIGPRLTLERLRRRLGTDLLDPGALARGGVLPSFVSPAYGLTGLWAILLGEDPSHLESLRRRVLRLGLVAL